MSQLTCLNRREHMTIQAINDVLYPEGGTIPYSANQVGVCEHVDDYVYNLQPKNKILVRLLILLIEIGPLLFFRAKKRFTNLAIQERQAYMEWLELSPLYPLRIILISIRTIIGMAFLADERVLKAMGYFKETFYPGDPRSIPRAADIPGALKHLPKEARNAD